MVKNHIVMLSGGVDSTTVLGHVLQTADKEDVLAVFFHYGQKHDIEYNRALEVAQHYGVLMVQFDATQFFQYSDSTLLQGRDELDHTSYEDQAVKLNNTPASSYVPFRNGLFLSICAVLAASTGAENIYYGNNKSDYELGTYPDCRSDFAYDMQVAISTGIGRQIYVHSPLEYKTKTDVVKYGLSIGVPYDLTYSCYEGKEDPCGVCASCRKRDEAFAEVMKGEDK